jgi:hypothetical protein
MYFNCLARLVKPGGPVGIAKVGLTSELGGEVPAHLREWWAQVQPWCFHPAAWWARHWGRTGTLDIEAADTLAAGWRFSLDSLRLVAPEDATEIRALEADAGRNLGYVRVVGGRRAEAPQCDPVVSIPAQYTKKPLLRSRDQ